MGSQEVGSRFEGYCFVYLPSPDLVNFTVIEWFDGLGNVISDQSRSKRQDLGSRIRVLPIFQLNDTHLVRTVVVDPLLASDEGYYSCQANFTGDFVTSPPAQELVFLDVLGKRESMATSYYVCVTHIQLLLYNVLCMCDSHTAVTVLVMCYVYV